ncbi:hypothetical protein [Gluconobacter kondonii]|uniref:hypothetical protein n=1 Tax=Gluconobacter kondonii TaxID=941463 RepID=UPI001B8B02DF|nr:hypothetical protein [Gluconobacter kondonii]MBS1054761.1 hypothetical protein [Gluconobacter kondonii]
MLKPNLFAWTTLYKEQLFQASKDPADVSPVDVRDWKKAWNLAGFDNPDEIRKYIKAGFRTPAAAARERRRIFLESSKIFPLRRKEFNNANRSPGHNRSAI